jgi:uncharacterized protein (TIGR02996 family)
MAASFGPVTLAPTFEQLARLRTLVAQANGGRRARTLELETVLEVAREALGSKLGFASRHAGDHVDARASTTLCLAVRSSHGVTVGVAGTRALDPDPGKGWIELRPWSSRLPAQNASRCTAWAERDRGDRLALTVQLERPRRSTHNGAGLLEAVLATPDDDGPRLVYADWLTEQGDPRGELIAIQCARSRLDSDAPEQKLLEEREWTLLSLHEEEWRNALGKDVLSVKFRRGFVDEVTLFTASFVERAEAMFALEPLRTVRVVDAGPEGAAMLAASPMLLHLEGLRLSNSTGASQRGIGLDGLGELLLSRNLHALESFSLEGQHLDDLGAMAIAKAGPAALPSLKALRLASDSLSAVGVEALCSARWFRRLKRVSFAANQLREVGAEALAFAPGATAWEELELDANLLGDAGARALAGHEQLGALRRLSLQRNHLGPAGVQVLLDSPRLKGLTGLRLDGNRLGGLLTEKLRRRFGAW